METSEFMRKLSSKFLWINIAAMAVVLLLVVIGTVVAMHIYTRHGESITIPDVRNNSYEASVETLQQLGMEVVVNDTGYVKSLPAGAILDQQPKPGTKVKTGRTIYLTINATNSPTIAVPDIIDNCSLREATARLKAMGFKLGEPQMVTGEKDWVYGLLANGRSVSKGDRVSIEAVLTIQAGSGLCEDVDTAYAESYIPGYEEVEGYVGDEPIEIKDAGAAAGDDFEIIE